MYVKKGWVALPVVFIFGLLLTIGCNEKFNTQKPDISKIDTTAETVKQKEEKTAKRDTVQIGGYNIVAEPNEYVNEIKLRRRYGKTHDSFKIEFNANGNKLSEVEKLKVVKDMFNLNEEIFSYKKKEDRWQMLYKGIEVDRFAIKISDNKATGSIYPEMDVDITVNITEQEAFETAKTCFNGGEKGIGFNYEYRDISSFFLGEEKIPVEEQKRPKGVLKIRYIHHLNNFYFCYEFEIGASIDDKVICVDPANNTIIEQYSTRLQAFPKCYKCVNNNFDVEDPCFDGIESSGLIPGNFQLSAKTGVTLPSVQNYRNGCLSIDGSFDSQDNVFFYKI